MTHLDLLPHTSLPLSSISFYVLISKHVGGLLLNSL